MKKIIAYTDGASRGNPGNAGIGIVLFDEDGETLAEISDYIGETTNNIAEYTALVAALKAASEMGCEEIELVLDSELVVKQINGEYRVKNQGLKPLYKEATELLATFKSYKVRHVRREYNKKADELANQGIDDALDEQEL